MSKLDRLSPSSLASNPRATLASWLRYQPFVEAAVERHPQRFEFQPTNLEPTTAATRLRDAVRGALAFGYPCAHDAQRLARWFNETTIRYEGTKVIIEPKRPAGLPPVLVAPTAKLSFASLEDDERDAFMLLLSRGRIVGPVMAKQCTMPTNIPPNVEVLPRPDGSVVFI